MFRLMNRRVCFLMIFCAATMCSTEVFAQTVTTSTARILQFQQQRGNFAQSNIAKLNGMVLQFNQNGTFAVFFPNSTLSPMQGNFSIRGNSIILSAGKTLRTGMTGYVRGDFVAQIDFTNNGPVMTMLYATGSGISAVINNGTFSASSSNAFYAVVLLR